jgi:activator of 2-hydroxyglutaryl-CoA dehydratase
MSRAYSSSSQRQLLNASRTGVSPYGEFFRASSAVSTSDINFPKVIDKNDNVGEQTLYQVEIVNEKLLRKTHRSELAAKKKCLTRRWQTALVVGIVVGSILIGVCK